MLTCGLGENYWARLDCPASPLSPRTECSNDPWRIVELRAQIYDSVRIAKGTAGTVTKGCLVVNKKTPGRLLGGSVFEIEA